MNKVIFSFFSGSGFLDLGFENAGFDVVFVNEIEKAFIGAYEHSRKIMGHSKPKYGYHESSIDDYLTSDEACYLSECVNLEKKSGNIVGFIGGPPCPDFSVGGKNKGRDGENGRLSQSYVDCIRRNEPDWFVFENVKGLWKTKKHREFYEKLKIELIDAGYLIFDRLINSLEFAVPQDRERVIMFGVKSDSLVKKSPFDWEKYMKYPNGIAFDFNWPTTSTFKSDLNFPIGIPEELTVQYWFEKNGVTSHPNANAYFTPRAGLAKFLLINEGDTSKKSYKRLHRHRYSPTAAYGNNEVHLHPTEARRLSAAEALAIQSLPKEFEFPKTMTLSSMFKTIGNGVPYLFSFGIASSIKDYLEL
ncbi:DNA cytosine methyltransferase [Pectobacterium carotovorum]|uniref:DNA cytosine methyltransferase n=2 Tax=Pectobacterium carotovorum TaxID=554 RepID=UPI001E3EE7DE|nr:DNA cytosine methyltransferase [Pectobacterium carotovorum]UFT94273.1 DNA cytosine methyltransferase [Pectobacterium carotovorum]